MINSCGRCRSRCSSCNKCKCRRDTRPKILWVTGNAKPAEPAKSSESSSSAPKPIESNVTSHKPATKSIEAVAEAVLKSQTTASIQEVYCMDGYVLQIKYYNNNCDVLDNAKSVYAIECRPDIFNSNKTCQVSQVLVCFYYYFSH